MADGILWQLATQAGQNAFGNAPDAFAEGLKFRQQQDQEATRKSVLQQLTSGQDIFDPQTGGVGQLVRKGDLQGAAALAGIAQHLQSGNKYYGTPIYGTDDKGNTRVGTFDQRGNFKAIDTPGFNPTPGVKTIETPQGVYVVGSKTGQLVGPPAGQPGQPPPATANGQPQAPGYYPNACRRAAGS